MSSPIHTETLWINTPHGRLFCRRWCPTHRAESPQPPPIILFHDSLGCVALWRDFPEQLCQTTGREVIAYDRLGFGQSDAYPGSLPQSFIRDEAERFFGYLKAALQIERFVALGHSVGGAMAAACASLYPQDCQALITIAAQAFVEERTLQGIRAAESQFQQPGQMARLHKYHGDKADWVLGAWTRIWLAETFRGWTIEGTVGEVQCPVLALHGEQDEYGSVEHPVRIAKLSMVEGECSIIEACGHVPHREAPRVVLGAVGGFLGHVISTGLPRRP